MIITVDKKELGEVVQIASRYSERRTGTLPVLGGILVLAEDGVIRIRATNLETSIDLVLPGDIKTKGAAVLPSGTLKDVTSSFSGTGPVALEFAGEVLTLSSGNGKSSIKTLPLDDFPITSFPEASKGFSLSGVTLKQLIQSVAFCASTSSIRPELGAVYIRAEGGVLTAVATDSFRLAEKKVSGVKNISPFSILIPARNALELAQTIPDGEVLFSTNEHAVVFSWEKGTVSSRLVSVAYPDYAQIIPKKFASEATLLRKDFESALKRASVFADSFQKIRLEFSTKGKRVVFSARNTDVGETKEPISASIEGDDLELSFNVRYLQAPMPLITQESLSLSASGIGRPLVMRGAGEASFLYLVMPMNQ
jgi:DNA polymerase-3 subunit beta